MLKTSKRDVPPERRADAFVPEGSSTLSIALEVMQARGISPASLAAQLGMNRCRAYRVLSRDPDKRWPIRVQELDSLLIVLGIDNYDLGVFMDLGSVPDISTDEKLAIAPVISEILRGFASDFALELQNISGLEFSDLSTKHSLGLRKHMLDRAIQELGWYSNRISQVNDRFYYADAAE